MGIQAWAAKEGETALRGLRTEGWAAFQPAHLSLEECVRRHAESLRAAGPGRDPDLVLYNASASRVWKHPLLEDGVDDGPITAFVESVGAMIATVLFDESFELDLVGIRRNVNVVPEGFGPHIDRRQYLTVVLAFAADPAPGLGTVIYRTSDARGFEAVRLPASTAVIVTGDQREAATGIPATVHSATRKPLAASPIDRCVLIITYRGIGQSVAPELQKELDERVVRARAFAAGASFE